MTDTGSKPSRPAHDAAWDAGDLGCGELIMHLNLRLRAMPGKVLTITARDPGAPADLPAFCRMAGHELVHTEPDSCMYWIRARTRVPNR